MKRKRDDNFIYVNSALKKLKICRKRNIDVDNLNEVFKKIKLNNNSSVISNRDYIQKRRDMLLYI
jgi:hypothetical protein